jgi:rubrerythrin
MGKKTLENLAKAFVGESQARNRYSFYASVAKKEGYEKIAEVFNLTAEQEKQHAKWLLRLINQIKEDKMEEVVVGADVPVIFGTTIENIKSAIAGENHEHTTMYPKFADIAREEGYPEIATRLEAIAKAEEHHEERYMKILTQLEKSAIFEKAEEISWVCRECGYHVTSKSAPEICPSCDHPQSYYEVKCEEF